MASRSLRRGLGVRVVFTAALLALVAASLPAHAVIIPQIVGSSVEDGYASPTILLPDHVGLGAARPFDPADPPYQWSDGEVRFNLSRWGVTLCDKPASIATVTTPLTVFTDGVNATVTVEDYNGRPDRVIRIAFSPTVRPHGLIAGDAPATVTWTASALQPDGTCGPPTVVSETYVLDREVPLPPVIDTPSVFLGLGPNGGCNPDDIEGDLGICDIVNPGGALQPVYDELGHTGACGSGTFTFRCTDPIGLAEPQSGVVTVSGSASDPLTKPFEDQDPDKFWETSGVKAVVVRLYSVTEECLIVLCRGFPGILINFGGPGGGFEKSYTQEFACADFSPVDATIARCADTAAFSIDIPIDDLTPGIQYAVDAYALDIAGYRSAVATNLSRNSDNLQGPESDSVAFQYMSN